MPKLIGFSDPVIARRLRASALRPPDQPRRELFDDSDCWLLRTPGGGIAAFEPDPDPESESVIVPSAWCLAWALYLDENDNVRLRKEQDSLGDQLKLLVANLSETAIPANRWIGATRYVGGVLKVIWVDCPPGAI